jgi:polyferredoxin
LSIFLGGGFLIGIIALAAVLLRLFQDGFTPNRTALIGMNILLTVNIGGLLYHELKWLFKKAKQPNSTVWIATYLPIYLLWSLFMVFLYPWIFGLR